MTTSLNLSPNHSRRRRREYVAGRGGVRVTWQDGTLSTYAQGALVVLHGLRRPVRVEGRLLTRGRGNSGLGYEAPALEPN